MTVQQSLNDSEQTDGVKKITQCSRLTQKVSNDSDDEFLSDFSDEEFDCEEQEEKEAINTLQNL